MSPTDDQHTHGWRLNRLEERVDKLDEDTRIRHEQNIEKLGGLAGKIESLDATLNRLVNVGLGIAAAIGLYVLNAVLHDYVTSPSQRQPPPKEPSPPLYAPPPPRPSWLSERDTGTADRRVR